VNRGGSMSTAEGLCLREGEDMTEAHSYRARASQHNWLAVTISYRWPPSSGG
jgi:hypothetical protein